MAFSTRSDLTVVSPNRRRTYVAARTNAGLIQTDLSQWVTIPATTNSTFSPENETVNPTFITPVQGVAPRARTFASGNIQVPLIPEIPSVLVPPTLRALRAGASWTPVASSATITFDDSTNILSISDFYLGTNADDMINGAALNLNAIRDTSLIRIRVQRTGNPTNSTLASFIVNASSVVYNTTDNSLDLTLRDTLGRDSIAAYITANPTVYLARLTCNIIINENRQRSVDLIVEDYDPNTQAYIYNIYPNCKFNELTIDMNTDNFVQLSVSGDSAAPLNSVSASVSAADRRGALNNTAFSSTAFTNIFTESSSYADSYSPGEDKVKYRLSVPSSTPHIPESALQTFEINNLSLTITNTTQDNRYIDKDLGTQFDVLSGSGAITASYLGNELLAESIMDRQLTLEIMAYNEGNSGTNGNAFYIRLPNIRMSASFAGGGSSELNLALTAAGNAEETTTTNFPDLATQREPTMPVYYEFGATNTGADGIFQEQTTTTLAEINIFRNVTLRDFQNLAFNYPVAS